MLAEVNYTTGYKISEEIENGSSVNLRGASFHNLKFLKTTVTNIIIIRKVELYHPYHKNSYIENNSCFPNVWNGNYVLRKKLEAGNCKLEVGFSSFNTTFNIYFLL